MDEEFMKQIYAELIESTGAALALVVAAMSRQMDAERLVGDLRAQLKAAEVTKQVSPLAIRIASHALAAADAETALRARSNH